MTICGPVGIQHTDTVLPHKFEQTFCARNFKAQQNHQTAAAPWRGRRGARRKRSKNYFVDPRCATEYARVCLYLSKYHGIGKASFEPISSVFLHKTTQGPVLDLGYSMTCQVEQRTPKKVSLIFLQEVQQYDLVILLQTRRSWTFKHVFLSRCATHIPA